MKKVGKFGDPKQIFAGDTGSDFFKTHKTGTVPRKKPEMIVSLSTENGVFSLRGKVKMAVVFVRNVMIL